MRPSPVQWDAGLKNLTDEGYLGHLIRGTESLPRISFRTRDDIKAQLAGLGTDINDVFFKCTTEQSHGIWGNGRRSKLKLSWYGHDSVHLYSEVSQSIKIHGAIPGNTAAPIAIAKMGDETVGYFIEHVNGSDLSSLFARPSDNGLLVRVAGNLSEVIAKMHDKGIGHGDLSLSNIMLTGSMEIKLIDPICNCFREPDSMLIEYDRKALDGILRIANSTFVD
ncbi:MAG: hypothetical protein KGI06_04510 [Candidatus Micrarchaeota archaeon]|nr:hypothetical protein [Candidatus Micrarchaeota archaeon]